MYIWCPPFGPLKRSQARPQKSLAGKLLVSVMNALLDVFGATMWSECVPLCAWSAPTVGVNPPLIETFQVAVLSEPVSKSSHTGSDAQLTVPAPPVPAPPVPAVPAVEPPLPP